MTLSRRTRNRAGLAASLALVAVAAASLSGCAGTASALDPKESPLMKVLGPLGGLDDEDALRDQERAVQKVVATCMSDKGFDYTPSDKAMSITIEGPGNDKSEDWISKNGYGFSDLNKETDKDPNEAYVNSLSETEQTAYYEALYGPAQPADQAGGEVVEEGAPPMAGCTNEAFQEVNGKKMAFLDDKKFKKLLDSMGEIYEQVEKAPAVKSVASKWSDCMAEGGYTDMKVKSDAMEYASKKQNDLYETDGTASKDGKPAEPSAADLKKVREIEINTALADFRCDKKTGYTDAKLKMQFELEEKFVREHKAELDELVDTYGDKK